MASPLRGMANLHTMAGRADGPVKPHKVYLRLSVLEMEKARLNIERVAAQKRIDRIIARNQEIEAEKEKIFATLPPEELSLRGKSGPQEGKPALNLTKGKRGKSFRY